MDHNHLSLRHSRKHYSASGWWSSWGSNCLLAREREGCMQLGWLGMTPTLFYCGWTMGLAWLSYKQINQSVFHGIPVWLRGVRSTAKLNIMTTSWYFLMWFARESIHCTYPRIGFWFLRTDLSESLQYLEPNSHDFLLIFPSSQSYSVTAGFHPIIAGQIAYFFVG